MEVEEAYLFFKGRTSRSLDLYKKIPALGTLWAGGFTKNYAVSGLKLSMYTSYGSERIQLNFKVKVTGSL